MTTPSVQALVAELAAMRRDIDDLKRTARTPQLPTSALMSGQSIALVDAESQQRRGRIGWQPDGGIGIVTEGGDPPPAPSAPRVTPSIGGLLVAWDSTMAEDLGAPSDLAHVAVHVSTASGFTPSAATFTGTITQSGQGGALPVTPLPYDVHYVRLVGVLTSGVTGAASEQAAATPLQVEGPDLVAGSITTAHLQAGAVTADKLAALLVLASRIVAGDPSAARVELNSGGLRAYDTTGALTVVIDADGSAVFTGTITGSEITGSRMTIGQAPGAIGVIESDGDTAYNAVTAANNARAEISATEIQAEFAAYSDALDPSTPSGGVAAATGLVGLVLNADNADDTKPRLTGAATLSDVYLQCASGNGNQVKIFAGPDFTSIGLQPEHPRFIGAPAANEGNLYAFRSASDDVPLVTLQSPTTESGTGAGRRSLFFLTAATNTQTTTQATHWAHEHIFLGESVDGVISTADGVVSVDDTHSILAGRHAPTQEAMLNAPDFATSGNFVDFTSAEFPAIPFHTSWSGRTRVTITAGGYNYASTASSLALGFRLSGGSAVPAHLDRAWYVQYRISSSAGAFIYRDRVVHLQLNGNTDYTLTPAWRLSSGDASTAAFNLGVQNSIVVEALT